MNTKNYFDLTKEKNNILNLSIQKKDRFDCYLIDQSGVIYDGFKLAESVKGNTFTLCDLSFKKSGTDEKYQARITFRKTDQELQDKTTRSDAKYIRIPFHTGKEGYRHFWKMIAFLYKWKETIDLGEFEDFFAVTERSLAGILPKIANLENKDTVLKSLEKLSKENLDNIDNLVNVTKIKAVLSKWEKNKGNDREINFWHPFLKKHFWIIPQIFSSPVNLFDDEFYVGGDISG